MRQPTEIEITQLLLKGYALVDVEMEFPPEALHLIDEEKFITPGGKVITHETQEGIYSMEYLNGTWIING